MNRYLITGFTPFDGREVNASWIAAGALAGHLPNAGIRTLELPVIWNTPRTLLEPLCENDCPQAIIALGEGRPGWFDIETRASRSPADRTDNDGNPPADHPFPEGPPEVHASIDAFTLQRRLARHDVPVRISRQAGGFLCEQTLYTLEMLRRQFPRLQTVAFVHLPPYGSPLTFKRRQRLCDESVLLDFSLLLFDNVMKLSAGETMSSSSLITQKRR